MMLSVESSSASVADEKCSYFANCKNRWSEHCNFRTEGAGYEMYQAIVYRYRSAYGFSFMERGRGA